MNEAYQRIQLAGEKKDAAQILDIIAAIKAGKLKNDLMLLNYYHEIPVSYQASVETVEHDFAELHVNQIQAVAVLVEKVTVLKSSHFPRDVIANANYVNVEKSKVVLSSFSYAVVRADRRMSVRVELNERLYASFNYPDGNVQGSLHDMSLTGISINADTDPGIRLTERGEISISFPTGVITLQASLLKVLARDAGYSLVFEIETTRATEPTISRYILRRQLEIIKELKDHPGVG